MRQATHRQAPAGQGNGFFSRPGSYQLKRFVRVV